jgi:cation transport ATPase
VVRETKGIRTTAEFRVHGLDCAEEILVIRKQLGREQGIHELNFDVVRGKMVVDFDSARVRPAQN